MICKNGSGPHVNKTNIPVQVHLRRGWAQPEQNNIKPRVRSDLLRFCRNANGQDHLAFRRKLIGVWTTSVKLEQCSSPLNDLPIKSPQGLKANGFVSRQITELSIQSDDAVSTSSHLYRSTIMFATSATVILALVRIRSNTSPPCLWHPFV
jgi:hypothetical protein